MILVTVPEAGEPDWHTGFDEAAAFERKTAHRPHRIEHRKAAEAPSMRSGAPKARTYISPAGHEAAPAGRPEAGDTPMILFELLFGLMLVGMVLLVLPFLLLMAGIAGAVLLWILAPAALVALLIFWLVFPGAPGIALLLLALVIGLILFEQRARRRAI
jgi:hypothetical protein